MTDDEEVLRLARSLTPFELPIGVYVVTNDGRFVECNRQVREIFRLPPEGKVNASITDFYSDPEQREQISRELETLEARGTTLVQKVIPFKVGEREIFVQDFSRALRDESGAVRGYVCCIVDVTEGERYNRLFETLPAGVYKLDENDRNLQANKAFARILGYDSPDEIDGRPVGEFYADKEEGEELRRRIEEKHPEPVTGFIAELVKKNGETIFVNINAHKVEDDDGRYAGREGTIIDVTREERYRRILRDVPVGLNVIVRKNGRDLIIDCNEQFAALFGFASKEDALGFDARRLHASEEDYERFLNALERATKRGEPLSGYELKVVTCGGEQRIVEISSRALRDSAGLVTGRTGAMRDITEEAELKARGAALQEQVRELTSDIGNTLHDYTTTLMMTHLSINPVIQALAPDPFDGEREVSPEQAEGAITAPAAQLAEAVERLLTRVNSGERAVPLPAQTLELLGRLLDDLKDYKKEVADSNLRPIKVISAAQKLTEVCSELDSYKLAREILRHVRDSAQELLRVANLISLHQVKDAVLEMDHQVSSLRDYITSNVLDPEPKTVCQVAELVTQVRYNLEEYARSRGVRFTQKVERSGLPVYITRRAVVRALANILHNAIKYSWSRESTKSPWITLRAYAADGFAHIEFENWGVAIPKEEIEQELVFRFGYRGRLSSDRGRVGTGIGLTDARRVARKHGGDVVVKSQPAVASRRDDDYRQPFVTVVTMKLPLQAA